MQRPRRPRSVSARAWLADTSPIGAHVRLQYTIIAAACTVLAAGGAQSAVAQESADPTRAPIEPPTGLKQRNMDDSDIGMIGTAKAYTVKLGAVVAFAAQPYNCRRDLTLEVEVVEYPGRFQFKATHSVSTTKSSADGAGTQFLEVVVPLQQGRFQKWNVRQADRQYMGEWNNNGHLVQCGPAYTTHESKWYPIIDYPSTTFRTPVPYQNVLEYPQGVVLATGSLLGGNEASLRGDDANYLRMQAVGANPHALEWTAAFSNITPQSRNARFRIRGRADRTCNEVIEVWLPSSSSWSGLASGSSTTAEREWVAAIDGPLVGYLDQGVLRLRVTCTRMGQSFVHRTELLELAYERATVPWDR